MSKRVLYNYQKRTRDARLGPNSAEALLTWLEDLAMVKRGVMRSGWKDCLFEVEAFHDPFGGHGPIFRSITLFSPSSQPGRTVYPVEGFDCRISHKLKGHSAVVAEIPGRGAKAWNEFFAELERTLFYYKLKV